MDLGIREWIKIDVGGAIEWLVELIQQNLGPLLDAIRAVIGFFAEGLEYIFLNIPPVILAILILLLALWRVGWRFGIFVAVAVVLIWGMNLWTETMSTMALVIASSLVALLIGFPTGIAMAKSNTVEAIIRPILDFMQTMPPFVYLIPAVIFFGLGKVPGAIATVIFAMPPAVRLTNLGIRQVSAEHVEAGLAFGCTDRQLLYKVQLPLALPNIMQGVNQTIMLALSMVVIAAMIGAGGLGQTVVTGIQRMNTGLGFEGGLGVVIVAILLDRLTESFGKVRQGEGLITKVMRLARGGQQRAAEEGETETGRAAS
ncbi:glycine betaine/proline transport system permease protein [Limimonas halophila]|uniref:Glycine betaine/proline transport system permease protein n=1 Tax=Limimonas halophila TaxID=1082479 RepID=A0A1G7PBJ3_9PROT|nr:glycine betaine/proline transport system permease protein [Limimonas halophila]